MHLQPEHVAREMLSWAGFELLSCTVLKTLWAGYGKICGLRACRAGDIGTEQNLILKIVLPPCSSEDEGHLRKMFSYEVEQHFYDKIAPELQGLQLAECLTSTSSMPEKALAAGLEGVQAIVMTDLRIQYPVAGDKRAVLTPPQVSSALRWLARFHRSYWTSAKPDPDSLIQPPLEEHMKRQRKGRLRRPGVWLNGGYTYLATRRTEYASLANDTDSEWSRLFCEQMDGMSMSIAELAAEFLEPSGRSFETFLHGDVKSENLFSTNSGDEVAFFDFQYIGVGVGVADLAKLLTCSVPLSMLGDFNNLSPQLLMGDGERTLLEKYYGELMARTLGVSTPQYSRDDFTRHWETALVDWCRFQASWGFWGNTNWLQARVRSILQDSSWVTWLKEEVEKQKGLKQG